jgi:hypothetical protein
MTPSELRHAIFAAFPPRPRPLLDELTRPGDDYWERTELRRELKYRTWTTLPRDVIWRRRADLIWLAPRGFGYYLPAWMLRAIDDPELRDYVLSALTDYPSWLPEGDRDDGLTPEQVAAIGAFLAWAASPAAAPAASDAQRAAIDAALRTYWPSRAGRAR